MKHVKLFEDFIDDFAEEWQKYDMLDLLEKIIRSAKSFLGVSDDQMQIKNISRAEFSNYLNQDKLRVKDVTNPKYETNWRVWNDYKIDDADGQIKMFWLKRTNTPFPDFHLFGKRGDEFYNQFPTEKYDTAADHWHAWHAHNEAHKEEMVVGYGIPSKGKAKNFFKITKK